MLMQMQKEMPCVVEMGYTLTGMSCTVRPQRLAQYMQHSMQLHRFCFKDERGLLPVKVLRYIFSIFLLWVGLDYKNFYN